MCYGPGDSGNSSNNILGEIALWVGKLIKPLGDLDLHFAC